MFGSRSLTLFGLIATIHLFNAGKLPAEEEHKPLYLHWFSPGASLPSSHAATLRVYPNEEFELSLGKQKSLTGQIQHREGTFRIKATARHVAPSDFDTLAPLDKRLEAYGVGFAGGAAPSYLVLSKTRSVEAVVRALAEQDDDQDKKAARTVPFGWDAGRPTWPWNFADLAEDVKDLTERSVERGRKAYVAARCMSCHHENKEHSAFGPHLGDLAKRFQGAELLRHTLEPSREIHGDYHTYVFVMKDGRVIVGFVVKQDAREIHVVANPTISEEKSILQKKDIEARRIYTRSMMPEGLLDSLGREDILDMLAFIQSAQTSKRQPAE